MRVSRAPTFRFTRDSGFASAFQVVAACGRSDLAPTPWSAPSYDDYLEFSRYGTGRRLQQAAGSHRIGGAPFRSKKRLWLPAPPRALWGARVSGCWPVGPALPASTILVMPTSGNATMNEYWPTASVTLGSGVPGRPGGTHLWRPRPQSSPLRFVPIVTREPYGHTARRLPHSSRMARWSRSRLSSARARSPSSSVAIHKCLQMTSAMPW